MTTYIQLWSEINAVVITIVHLDVNTTFMQWSLQLPAHLDISITPPNVKIDLLTYVHNETI